jgi:hypothetical protein
MIDDDSQRNASGSGGRQHTVLSTARGRSRTGLPEEGHNETSTHQPMPWMDMLSIALGYIDNAIVRRQIQDTL